MATKQLKAPEKAYIFYEKVETPDGPFTLAMDDAENAAEVMRQYQQKLLLIRGIPLDTTNIDPRNPMLEIIRQQMPWLKSRNERMDYLRGYYQSAELEARQEAAMLAAFADPSNTFSETPAPYKSTALPGLEDDLPPPPKNLNHPLERRLKQIVDLINKYPDLFGGAMARVAEKIFGLEDEETDKDGFQP